MFPRAVALSSVILLLGLCSASQAQVKLELKNNEGSNLKHKTVSKTHQLLTIQGQKVETDADETVMTSVAVGKRKADGTLEITSKIDSLNVQLNLPGNMVVTFDSASPPEKKDDGPLGFLVDVFKVIAGSSYTVVVDKQDKFVSVDGLQQTLDKAGQLDPKAAALLKSRLDSDRIKKEYDQQHAFLPDILIRPGDSWERTESNDIGGGQTLTFKKRYEYQGTVEKDGKTLDKIGVKATAVTYAMDADTESPAKVVKSDLAIDSSDGTILFDRKLGDVVERSGVNKIKGTMTISINGTELPSELDLTLEAKTEVTP